ncbi:MAG: ATP-binding protein [Flavobacteriales bacterium]|jgi:hypothetical protein|nr:ATP-binding protein [Flavobacteriales bacterium]
MLLKGFSIPENSHQYLFGEGHNEFYIDLGIQEQMNFCHEQIANQNNSFIQYHIHEKEASLHNNIWNRNIKSVTAIVGENGVGKSTILEGIFKSKFLSEPDPLNNDLSEGKRVYIFYTPHFSVPRGSIEFKNRFYISKYFQIIDDLKDTNSIDFSKSIEMHQSFNIQRIIDVIELNFLEDIDLPIFDKVLIDIESHSVTNHNTSYEFRDFFSNSHDIYSKEYNHFPFLTEDYEGDYENHDDFNLRLLKYKHRLKLNFIIGIIEKIHQIMERSGNKYLFEGKYKEVENLGGINLLEYFKQFINKANFNDGNNLILPKLEILNLLNFGIDIIAKLESIKSSTTQFEISFSQTHQFIQLYHKFLKSFGRIFTYNSSPLLTFNSPIKLSTGELSMFEMFASLLNLQKRIEADNFENYVILLDEADLGFHPQWKKKFIYLINKYFPKIFSGKKIQIIFTTHDPLTLSDIPKQNIIYLEKDYSIGLTKILSEEEKAYMKSFGANIHDLLSDSFFIDDGLMGEFAKSKIDEVIKWINDNKDVSKRSIDFDKELKEKQIIIKIIDEPIIRNKLAEMITRLRNDNTFEKDILQKQIDDLIAKRDKL